MNGFDPVYGARPLRRLVQSAIGDQLAKALLAGEIRDGDTVRVDLDPMAEGGTGALVVGRALPVVAGSPGRHRVGDRRSRRTHGASGLFRAANVPTRGGKGGTRGTRGVG